MESVDVKMFFTGGLLALTKDEFVFGAFGFCNDFKNSKALFCIASSEVTFTSFSSDLDLGKGQLSEDLLVLVVKRFEFSLSVLGNGQSLLSVEVEDRLFLM